MPSMPFNLIDPRQSQVDALGEQPQDTPVAKDHNPEMATVAPEDKKRHDEFRSRIDACKAYRRKLIPNWTVSIDYRRGKPFSSQTDDDQVAVNLDWSFTKAKQASLFSQVPHVHIDHPPQTLPKTSPWMAGFEQKFNDAIVQAGIESAMDESLPDCINAAGIGVAIVSYEAITEDVDVPTMDLSKLPPQVQASVHQTGLFNGQPLEMTTVPNVVDKRYVIQRISPADLLWPLSYTGANFDNAPWLGRSGRMTWADALQKFKTLKPEDKETILGEDRPFMDKLTHDVDKDKIAADEMVGFEEVFYKEFQYDAKAQSFDTIHHLVFINGKDTPVIDEPWKGQHIDQEKHVVLGAQKYPIRVLTLTYITDETIPPSDSAIGRPQVNEINKARTQMIRQRERSLPVRWFDVNRVDPSIQQGLMRGTWQAMIPVQGEGSRVIGEVARAAMPQENFMFDKIAKSDLSAEWTIGGDQLGTGEGVNTKGEADVVQSNFKLREGRERARVTSFFLGIAEVLGGLLCLYEDPASFGQGFDPSFSQTLSYSILADATILLDSNQKLARMNQFLNTYAKSGWVNIEPVLQEIASLTGLDPSSVIRAPQPKPPVEPNISLRLTGVEDMLNPLALAFLIKSGQAPGADLIEQAKQLIQQSVVPPQGMQMPSSVQPQGGLPMLSGTGGPPPGAPLAPPTPGPPPGTPLPAPAPPAIGQAHPNMAALDKITKRTESGKG